jgi:hypothetical protein
LVTFGESQISIFNYESGDLLMSLDLMKSYGTNLTTFGFKEVNIRRQNSLTSCSNIAFSVLELFVHGVLGR